jgi:hypothetical protein
MADEAGAGEEPLAPEPILFDVAPKAAPRGSSRPQVFQGPTDADFVSSSGTNETVVVHLKNDPFDAAGDEDADDDGMSLEDYARLLARCNLELASGDAQHFVSQNHANGRTNVGGVNEQDLLLQTVKSGVLEQAGATTGTQDFEQQQQSSGKGHSAADDQMMRTGDLQLTGGKRGEEQVISGYNSTSDIILSVAQKRAVKNLRWLQNTYMLHM